MAPMIRNPVRTSSRLTKNSQAYVTFLTGNKDYIKCVVGLAKGLRKVESSDSLMVAVLPDVPSEHRRELVAQGCIVKEIEPVYPPENQTQFAMAYYVINYSKLRIWEFVEYHKMIYLDGDIQIGCWRTEPFTNKLGLGSLRARLVFVHFVNEPSLNKNLRLVSLTSRA